MKPLERPLLLKPERVLSCLLLPRLTQDYLHSKGYVHGNIGARSVLVGGDLTAKLWGLGSLYRRTTRDGPPGDTDAMELRKWQAPEVLARRALSQSSDV